MERFSVFTSPPQIGEQVTGKTYDVETGELVEEWAGFYIGVVDDDVTDQHAFARPDDDDGGITIDVGEFVAALDCWSWAEDGAMTWTFHPFGDEWAWDDAPHNDRPLVAWTEHEAKTIAEMLRREILAARDSDGSPLFAPDEVMVRAVAVKGYWTGADLAAASFGSLPRECATFDHPAPKAGPVPTPMGVVDAAQTIMSVTGGEPDPDWDPAAVADYERAAAVIREAAALFAQDQPLSEVIADIEVIAAPRASQK